MVVFGSLVNAQVVWDLADVFMGMMAIVNIYAIIALHPKAIKLLEDYKKQRKKGKEAVFNASDYEEFSDIEIWKNK